MFVFMLLFPVNALVSFGTCSIPKLSKQVKLSFSRYNAIEWVTISDYSSIFITYALPSILRRFCLE